MIEKQEEFIEAPPVEPPKPVDKIAEREKKLVDLGNLKLGEPKLESKQDSFSNLSNFGNSSFP